MRAELPALCARKVVSSWLGATTLTGIFPTKNMSTEVFGGTGMEHGA